MFNFLRYLAVSLVIAGLAFAQAAAQSSGASDSGQASTASSGSVAGVSGSSQQMVQAVLTKSVDAKKARQGDKVEAKTIQEVRSDNGFTIPKGTKLIGHVTEVKARDKQSKDSNIGIAFDNAVLKSGQQVPFHAMIAAIAAPAASTPANDVGMDASSNAGIVSNPAAMGGGPLGGPVGGVAGTAGQAVGGVTRDAGSAVGSVGGAAGSTVGAETNSTVGAGAQPGMGIPGITIDAAASNQTNGSVFASSSKNVKLDSGSTLVLRVVPK